MVDKVMMPPIGLLLGEVDFSELKLVLQGASTADDGTTKPEVAIFYGQLINAIVKFTIVAFCLFIIIKAMNTAKAKFDKKEAAAAPPPSPPEDVMLLREIRDSLRAR
jgi:large conductance mechanosensitive channel